MGTLSLLGAAAHADEVVVEPGENTLLEAVAAAAPGDTLLLEPGLYTVSQTVLIDKDLTIKGATGDPKDVHIAAVEKDLFDPRYDLFPEDIDQGHILFARAPAQKVSFLYFTVKNAPETDIDEGVCTESVLNGGLGLNLTECFGDGIHADGVAHVIVRHVQASLNAGNGFWVDGAEKAYFGHVVGVYNGAFGIDVDTAQDLEIRKSKFTANEISGIEASGHEKGGLNTDYSAVVLIEDTLARANGEIGIEVERFASARMENIECSDNREDGFDADRVNVVEIEDSRFLNNLDDGLELFPIDIDPLSGEQPADFVGSTVEKYDDLDIRGNLAGDEINHALTEN
jgi:hypothetical protein